MCGSAGTFVDHTLDHLSYSDFIHKELVQFSKFRRELDLTPVLLDSSSSSNYVLTIIASWFSLNALGF